MAFQFLWNLLQFVFRPHLTGTVISAADFWRFFTITINAYKLSVSLVVKCSFTIGILIIDWSFPVLDYLDSASTIFSVCMILS